MAIYESLMDSNAEKSASLLKFLKEKQLSDNKIMAELDVNTNAYYTLRSRLNEKIEEYLVKAMESPKADILKKVANINEMVFTKKRSLVIPTLKKLEKELIDFDLSNELITIYKNLKRLHLHTPSHYYYSQLYNKHVAYTLALDKAEDILAEYFKKYGYFYLTGDETTKSELIFFKKEIKNISRLYQSHRLYVFQSCLYIFHHIFVEPGTKPMADEDNIEHTFEKIDKIFETYATDQSYHHLRIVFDFLKSEYYYSLNAIKKGDKYSKDVNDFANLFLTNYSFYTFPSIFLTSKLNSIHTLADANNMLEENKLIFADYEADPIDLPKYIVYHCFRAISFYNAEKYDQSAKLLNSLLNETAVKKFPEVLLDIKCFLALQYCLMKDDDLFNQLMSSIQRQIRIIGKKKVEHIVPFTKAMKMGLNNTGKQKVNKIKTTLSKIKFENVKYFTPIKFIQIQEMLFLRLIN
jgi:hypothetical protein